MSTCARCGKEGDIRPHNSSGICFGCATKAEAATERRSKATMAFTDEDIKRLKEEACSVHPTNCRPWISGNDLQALVARLEAAEKIIGDHTHITTPKHWCLICDHLLLWRKVAGK